MKENALAAGNARRYVRSKPLKLIPIEIRKKKEESCDKQGHLLGCGVCVPDCKTSALQLIKRKQNVIHPETTFERIILQSLESGNNSLYATLLAAIFITYIIGDLIAIPFPQ